VLEITDDVIGSGKVEAFGLVFEKRELSELYTEICSADAGPWTPSSATSPATSRSGQPGPR
jgi:hypothetical protein